MISRWARTVFGLAFAATAAVAAPLLSQSSVDAAELARNQDRTPESEQLLKNSLALHEKALGPDHPNVASLLDDLAELYRDQGRTAEAEPLLKRSLALREKALGPSHADVAASLNNLAELYDDQGRYAEAEPLYKRSLALREKALGPGHLDVAASLNNLAALHRAQGRYAEAEPLYKRSLALREKALGPGHLDVATSLNNLAVLYRDQGRYADAEPLYKRSLALREKALGPGHLDVATSLNNLAALYRAQGRTAEAEPLYMRSLAISEKAVGLSHPDVADVLNNLAALYSVQGRDAEAEPLYKRSLALREKALGPDHRDVAASLNNLAVLYEDQGRTAAAEPLLKRSLAIYEKALGPSHPAVAASLGNLARLYNIQGRHAEAVPLFKRSLAISEKALGPGHPVVAETLNNLAALYHDQGRTSEAAALFKRSLAIAEKVLGTDHPEVARTLNNLAAVYRTEGFAAEAEPLYKRSLALLEKALGPGHLKVVASMNNLAELYHAQGRTAEAEPLFKRSLAIAEKALGPDHPVVAASLNNLALFALSRNDEAGAAESWRRATAVLQRRAERGLGTATVVTSKGGAPRDSLAFEGLVKTTHRLTTTGREPALEGVEGRASRMFDAAQWIQASEAAQALAQMAARSAGASSGLAMLVRERQDLVSEWSDKDKRLIAAKSDALDKRQPESEKALGDRLAAIEARLAEIDSRFTKDFPDYAALVSPRPIGVAAVQANLRHDEALVLFLDTGAGFKPLPEETFIWVVTKSEMRWLRSDLGTEALQREVAALRCGLDYDGTWGASNATCAMLLKTSFTPEDDRQGKPLPFDTIRAHALYKSLLGDAESLIRGKHLIIVPSGALTQLPFQVLVTAPAAKPPASYADYRKVAWLGRSNPITVLPAVSSLHALRRNAKTSAASKPFFGVGNPLLDGPNGDYASKRSAALARAQCGGLPKIELAKAAAHRGLAAIATRAGIADVAQLRRATPLPETADELCDVAQLLGAAEFDVRLGARASEQEIRQLSEQGELRRYRVLHFATHGALAGEASGSTEPGLLLTPPSQGSEADDGYLSASEVAGLKLDADWVILSACNTAAGEARKARALSGLARAFFYAGARALLVSHWYVDSEASVALIKGAFGVLKADAGTGRAEALRRAMVALIDTGPERFAHPAAWAPFVVVGEGAGAR